MFMGMLCISGFGVYPEASPVQTPTFLGLPLEPQWALDPVRCLHDEIMFDIAGAKL